MTPAERIERQRRLLGEGQHARAKALRLWDAGEMAGGNEWLARAQEAEREAGRLGRRIDCDCGDQCGYETFRAPGAV